MGVIGVVAAMTIPTLVKNYEKKVTVTKLKKVYSTLNQAYKMSIYDNGASTASQDDSMGSVAYFQKYWEPYIKKSHICTTYAACGYKFVNDGKVFKTINDSYSDVYLIIDGQRTSFFTDDGVMYLVFVHGGKYGAPATHIWVDLNGGKEPNMFGKDVFWFERDPQNGVVNVACHNQNQNYINSNCSKTLSSGYYAGECCLAKIVNDGWQIKDDYPW